MDHFEHLRRMQELIERMSIPSQLIQKQINLMDSMKGFRPPLIPDIEKITRFQKTLGDSIHLLYDSPLLAQIRKAQEITERITRLANLQLPIPEAIYPEIGRLIDLLEKTVPSDGYSEIKGTVTVRRTDQEHQEQNGFWTWETLKWFIEQLLIILNIIVAFMLSNSNSAQLERHHQEVMLQNERHHQEQMEQDERQHRESLEQKERHQKEMLDVISEFMERLESHLPNDQDIDESDHEAP